MDDTKQIKLLKDAIKAYENGEIIEAKDMAIEGLISRLTESRQMTVLELYYMGSKRKSLE